MALENGQFGTERSIWTRPEVNSIFSSYFWKWQRKIFRRKHFICSRTFKALPKVAVFSTAAFEFPLPLRVATAAAVSKAAVAAIKKCQNWFHCRFFENGSGNGSGHIKHIQSEFSIFLWANQNRLVLGKSKSSITIARLKNNSEMNAYFDYVGDLNPEDWDSSDREFEESLNHYFNHYCFALTLIVP